jgi:hypothetical protein
MKKTKRVRTAKSRKKAHEAASGPGGPTRKRLKHIAGDVMRQEQSDRRALDREAPRVISGTSNHTRLPQQLRLLHLPQSGAPHAFIIGSARQRAVPWASGQTGL